MTRAEGQRAEGRGQRAEGRGQRAAGRGQRGAGMGQRAKGSGQEGKRAPSLKTVFEIGPKKNQKSGTEVSSSGGIIWVYKHKRYRFFELGAGITFF